VFENVEFKRIFGPKREEETRGWRKFIPRNCMIYCLHQTLPGSRADPSLVGPDVIRFLDHL